MESRTKMSVIEPRVTRLDKKRLSTLIALFVVVMNIVLLSVYLAHRSSEYPIGWDTPYYITMTRYFEEQDFLSDRFGIITLLSVLHKVLGVSLIQLSIYLSVGLNLVLSLVSSLLAYRALRTNLTVFIASFIFVFWSVNNYILTISTFDNALGLTYALLALYCVVRVNSWFGVVPFFLFSMMVALTQFETFVFFVLMLGVYFLILTASNRSFVRAFRHTYRYIVSFALVTVISIFHFSNQIVSIFTAYTQRGDPLLNASIPYANTRSLLDVLNYFKYGITTGPLILVFCLGLVFVLWMVKRKENGHTNVLLAYFIASYSLLLYAVVRSSIPINRSIMLLPTSLFVGIGVGKLITLLRNRLSAKHYIAAIAAVMVSVLFLIPSYFAWTMRISPAIHSQVFRGFQQLNGYIEKNPVNNFVIVADTMPNEKAASAFYGLWYYWSQAIFPLPAGNSTYCIYIGTYKNYKLGTPTVRSDNEEYNSTSVESARCLAAMNGKRVPVFMIRGIAPTEYSRIAQRPETQVISSDLIRVE